MSTAARRQVVLVVVAVLAVCAGAVAALVVSRALSAPADAGTDPPPPTTTESSGLAAELNLSRSQAAEMKDIWENVRSELRDGFTKADNLQRRRDEEIAGMLNQEQRAKFEKLTKRYADEYEELQRRRQQAFERGVQATRKLLNERQRRRYDDLLKSRVRLEGVHLPGDEADAATTSSSSATQAAGQGQ